MANERMINTISCGVVFVEGPGNFAISTDEKRYVHAQLQDGLDQMAGYEPTANIEWSYSHRTVVLPNFNPSQGAEFLGLPISYYKNFDAALWNKIDSKIYFFRKNDYISIDPNNRMKMDAGFPKPISRLTQGSPQNFNKDIDTVLWDHINERVLFFKGAKFISVEPNNNWQMDPGYPRRIDSLIQSLPADFESDIDAAFWARTNKVYLFKDNKFIRVDPSNNWRIDAGYPKTISSEWQELTGGYNTGIDAAFMNGVDDKIYLFKNQSKVGNFFRVDSSNLTAETANPLNTGLGWGFEAVWRDRAQVALGFSEGKNGYNALSDEFQADVGTQFGFVVFVTKYPTAWYAYVNGKKMILRKAGADLGPVSFENWNGMSKTIAHEAAHVFGARDEYGGNACGKKQGRFIRTINGNSKTCPPPTVSCIMKSSSVNSICDFSRKSIGWWAFLEGIDTSFYHPHDEEIYLFSKDYFTRHSRNLSMQTQYAEHVSNLWPNLNMDLSDGFDASFWNENEDKLYFFKGNQYLRITPSNGWDPDPNFPIPIAGNLRIPSNYHNNIDAAMWNGRDSQIVLFKGSELILVDPISWSTVPGYPQQIDQFFQGLPTRFAQGIDAAVWSQVNNCAYLFKNGKYVKVDPHNNWMVEAGYPKWIDGRWDMAFPKTY